MMPGFSFTLFVLAALTISSRPVLSTDTCPTGDTQKDQDYEMEVLFMFGQMEPGCTSADLTLLYEVVNDITSNPNVLDADLGVKSMETSCIQKFDETTIDTIENAAKYSRLLTSVNDNLPQSLLRAKAAFRYFRLYKNCRFCWKDDGDQRKLEGKKNDKHPLMLEETNLRRRIAANKKGVITAGHDKYNMGDTFSAYWYIKDPKPKHWVGVFKCSETPSETVHSSQWVWACGKESPSQTCKVQPQDKFGSFTFCDKTDATGTQGCPLIPGSYKMVLMKNKELISESSCFQIEEQFVENIAGYTQGQYGLAISRRLKELCTEGTVQNAHCYCSEIYPMINMIPRSELDSSGCTEAPNVPPEYSIANPIQPTKPTPNS